MQHRRGEQTNFNWREPRSSPTAHFFKADIGQLCKILSSLSKSFILWIDRLFDQLFTNYCFSSESCSEIVVYFFQVPIVEYCGSNHSCNWKYSKLIIGDCSACKRSVLFLESTCGEWQHQLGTMSLIQLLFLLFYHSSHEGLVFFSFSVFLLFSVFYYLFFFLKT